MSTAGFPRTPQIGTNSRPIFDNRQRTESTGLLHFHHNWKPISFKPTLGIVENRIGFRRVGRGED